MACPRRGEEGVKLVVVVVVKLVVRSMMREVERTSRESPSSPTTYFGEHMGMRGLGKQTIVPQS